MREIIILDSSYFFLENQSIPGEVLALGQHLGVFGTGLGPYGPGFPETPSNDQYNHA